MDDDSGDRSECPTCLLARTRLTEKLVNVALDLVVPGALLADVAPFRGLVIVNVENVTCHSGSKVNARLCVSTGTS